MKSIARSRTALAVIALLATATGASAFFGGAMRDGRNGSHSMAQDGTVDDQLIQVANRVPGFGGMFVESDGRLAVYLLDPAQAAATEAAIAAVFGPGRVPAGGLHVLQADFSMLQLAQWYERMGVVLEIPRVSMTDLDEGRNRLAVGVEDAGTTPAVERALTRLGIPREAVLIEETGPIIPLN